MDAQMIVIGVGATLVRVAVVVLSAKMRRHMLENPELTAHVVAKAVYASSNTNANALVDHGRGAAGGGGGGVLRSLGALARGDDAFLLDNDGLGRPEAAAAAAPAAAVGAPGASTAVVMGSATNNNSGGGGGDGLGEPTFAAGGASVPTGADGSPPFAAAASSLRGLYLVREQQFALPFVLLLA